MKLRTITYRIKGKKYLLQVKPVSVFSSGLLFRKHSPPLLFTLNKERNFSIFSYFCKPFKAIWLDKDMNATKIVDVKTWKLNISGRGKYLLEIPEPLEKSKLPTRNSGKGLNTKRTIK